MRIRSHLDPTLFVVFLHVNAKQYDKEFQDLVRSIGWGPGTNLDPVLAALKVRERRILAHERFHFWQGLRLPFLNLHATLSLRGYFLIARKLAETEADWRLWADLGWSVPSFRRLDETFYVGANREGRLVFGRRPFSDHEFTLEFSIKEMLECGASIFDFQSSCEAVADMSNPDSFALWCKLNPAYVRIYKFYQDFLESGHLAIRTILPLINAAFYTSFPERAFVELMARMWGNFARPKGDAVVFLAQREPCRWPEVFQGWLRGLDYDYPVGSAPDEIDLDNFRFYYLDSNQWIAISLGGGTQHPFLGPPAAEWQKRAKTVPGLEFYLDQPGYVANDEAHQFAFAAEPQLRIVRVFLDDGSDRVFPLGEGLVGPAFHDKVFSKLSVSEFRGFILDTLASYGAFRRATGAQMTDAARTCHHAACPHFGMNYCNSYPLVPQHFATCGFPSRMDAWVAAYRR